MSLRKGFALLEVMLAVAIGTILSGILLASVGSMGNAFQKVSAVSSLGRRFTLIQQQFERDFSGIMSPAISLEDEQRREEEDQEADESDKDKKEKKPEAKTDTTKEKPKPKKLPYSFFSTNDEAGNCTQLTCITSNPVAVYGQATVRLMRVVYRFEPDPEHKDLFLLSRQQSDVLDFKDFSPEVKKTIRKYTIADGIKSWKVDYLIPKPPPEKEKDQAMTREQAEKNKKEKEDKGKKKKRELIPLSEWKNFETEEEEKKSKRPPYPTFIHVTLTLIDEQERPSSFELWYAPLYDEDKPYLVEGVFTLPDASSSYHDRFIEHKSRQQQIARLGGHR